MSVTLHRHEVPLKPLAAFGSEARCVQHLEAMRWPEGIVCPACSSHRRFYRLVRGLRRRCADCRAEFSVRIGTIFEHGRTPIRKWFIAAWLIAGQKALTPADLAERIGVSRKTARLMHYRLGDAVGKPPEQLRLGVETDGQAAVFRQILTQAVSRPHPALMEPWLGKLHNGDAVETMQRMPPSSVDLIVTAPPRNRLREPGERAEDAYVAWQRECLDAMMRVLRPDGAIFYVQRRRVVDGVLRDRSEVVRGFPVRQVIVWDGGEPHHIDGSFFVTTYKIVYMIAKAGFRLAKGQDLLGDVWRIPPDQPDGPPAPFPLELAQRCIRSTNARVVLDPFVGSGTTVLAAIGAEREWVGIDSSAASCEVARKRIAALGSLLR